MWTRGWGHPTSCVNLVLSIFDKENIIKLASLFRSPIKSPCLVGAFSMIVKSLQTFVWSSKWTANCIEQHLPLQTSTSALLVPKIIVTQEKKKISTEEFKCLTYVELQFSWLTEKLWKSTFIFHFKDCRFAGFCNSGGLGITGVSDSESQKPAGTNCSESWPRVSRLGSGAGLRPESAWTSAVGHRRHGVAARPRRNQPDSHGSGA